MLLPLVLVVGCQENALAPVKEQVEPADAQIDVSPTFVDFGEGAAGDQLARTVTLTSVGTSDLRIEGVTLQGTDAFSLTTAGPTTLAPGESVDMVVSWTPLSWDDEGSIAIESDAVTPQVAVDLVGEGLYPGLAIEPGSLSFLSDYGESDEQTLTVRSVGSMDLIVTQTLLTGASFAMDAGTGTLTLAPGESWEIPVTYTPPGEGDISTGDIWLTTNAPDALSVVPLTGSTAVPCYGMGEAWDRGVLDISVDFVGGLLIENLDASTPLCMDQWYLVTAPESQDAILGDADFDLGDDYPYGSVTIDPGDHLSFHYGGTTGNAWRCVEHDQMEQRGALYEFRGARAPGPLLDLALDDDQAGSWARQEDDAVMAIGRLEHYEELAAGDSADAGIAVWNIGEHPGVATVTETVPTGFTATAFSPEPESTVVTADGATYSWTVSLAGRVAPPDAYTDSVYDEVDITWILTRTGACSGRVTAPESTATWTDSEGVQTSTANPLVVSCL